MPFTESGSVSLTLDRQACSLNTSGSVQFDLNREIPINKIGEYRIEFRRTNYLLSVNPWQMSVTVTGRLSDGRKLVLHARKTALFGPLLTTRSYALTAPPVAPVLTSHPQTTPRPATSPSKNLETLVKQANTPKSAPSPVSHAIQRLLRRVLKLSLPAQELQFKVSP